MPVPTTITDLDPVAANNFPSGSETPAGLDNYQRAHASFIRQLYDQSTAFTRTLLDDTTAAEARATLGLGGSSGPISDRMVCPTDSPWLADNTGGSDPGAAFTAAMAVLSARGGGIFLIPGGTYTFTSTTGFDIPSNVCVMMYGATLDFSGAAEASRLRVTGTIGSNVLLTANVSAGDSVLPLASVSGLAAGDVLLLSSDDLVPLADIGGSTSETIGEFVTVKSISGLNVTIDGYLDGAYLTADNAKVQKVSGASRVSILGGRIVGRGTKGDGTSSSEIGISALYATQLRIRDVQVDYCDYQSIALDQCYDVLVDNPSIRQEDRGSVLYDIIQYGIAPKNATSKTTIRGGTITGGKHGIVWTENSLPGVGRDVTIDGTTIIGTWAAGIATHEGNERFDIVRPRLIGCERGLDIRVRSGRIIQPHIRNVPTGSSIGDAIYLSEAAGRILIDSPDIDGARFDVRMYDAGLPSGATPSEIVIKGGKIRNINQQGILLEHSENSNAKKGVTIQGVDFVDVAGDYVRLHGAFDGAIIKGNNFTPIAVTPTGYGVRLLGTSNTWITDNHFGAGLVPVRTEASTESVPATPTNIFMLRNTWENTGGFLSSTAISNGVREANIQKGTQAQTIASDAITIPVGQRHIIVDTEGSAATDDLATINGGDIGDVVVFRTNSSFRDVTFRDGTGNLQLAGDFVADTVSDSITLIRTGSGWQEVARSNNA